jgi:serine/threonine-protein kinase
LIRTDGVMKITDFGIARVPHDEVKTTGGMAPGTGAYMAPEQVMGKKLDARADLYSAAIVLYEMLTGVTPFEAPDRNEVLVRTAQVDEAPLPVTRRVAQAPALLDVLMARALAKDPVLRYPSAIELGEAFRSSLGLPTSPGWTAQQHFAHAASRISQSLRASTDPMDDVESERLRTAMMANYRR